MSNPGIQHFAAGYETDPDFTFEPNPACIGQTVNFDWANAGAYLSAGPCRPNFDCTITDALGNNIPPQAGDFTPSMSHAFAQPGIYTIRLTIQTTCGTEFMDVRMMFAKTFGFKGSFRFLFLMLSLPIKMV